MCRCMDQNLYFFLQQDKNFSASVSRKLNFPSQKIRVFTYDTFCTTARSNYASMSASALFNLKLTAVTIIALWVWPNQKNSLQGQPSGNLRLNESKNYTMCHASAQDKCSHANYWQSIAESKWAMSNANVYQ